MSESMLITLFKKFSIQHTLGPIKVSYLEYSGLISWSEILLIYIHTSYYLGHNQVSVIQGFLKHLIKD